MLIDNQYSLSFSLRLSFTETSHLNVNRARFIRAGFFQLALPNIWLRSTALTYPLPMFYSTVRLAILLLNLHFRSISFENYHCLTSNKFVFCMKLETNVKKKSAKSKPYTLLIKYNQMFTFKNVLNVWICKPIRLRIQNGVNLFCTTIRSEMVEFLFLVCKCL